MIRERTISRSIWKISEQREPKSQCTQSGLWKREMGEKSGNSKRLERAEKDGRRERGGGQVVEGGQPVSWKGFRVEERVRRSRMWADFEPVAGTSDI